MNDAQKEVYTHVTEVCDALKIEERDLSELVKSLDRNTFWPVTCGIVYSVSDMLLEDFDDGTYFTGDESEAFPYSFALTLLVRALQLSEYDRSTSIEYFVDCDPEPFGTALQKVSAIDPSWKWTYE